MAKKKQIKTFPKGIGIALPKGTIGDIIESVSRIWTEKRKEEAIKTIMTRIAEGESVRSILDKANRNELPARNTFHAWLDNDKLIANQYARATEQRAELIFEDILSIADNVGQDVIEVDGVMTTNHAVIQRDRLRVDSRKWMLSKMNPKKYSERQIIDATIEQVKPMKLIRPDLEEIKQTRNQDNN